jgi:hypothetical protein
MEKLRKSFNSRRGCIYAKRREVNRTDPSLTLVFLGCTGCQPPADTKVEFYFPSQPPHEDSWYDISLVDGYSLPMKIVPRGIDQVAML